MPAGFARILIEAIEVHVDEVAILLEVAKQFAEPGAACYATVPGGTFARLLHPSFSSLRIRIQAAACLGEASICYWNGHYHHRFEPILYGLLRPDLLWVVYTSGCGAPVTLVTCAEVKMARIRKFHLPVVVDAIAIASGRSTIALWGYTARVDESASGPTRRRSDS
jgi:hypothetical protein